jgi:hypothetical protein
MDELGTLSLWLPLVGVALTLWVGWRTTLLQARVSEMGRSQQALLASEAATWQAVRARHLAAVEALHGRALDLVLAVATLRKASSDVDRGTADAEQARHAHEEAARSLDAYNAEYLRSRLYLQGEVVRAAHQLRHASDLYLRRVRKDLLVGNRGDPRVFELELQPAFDELTRVLRREVGLADARVPGLAELVADYVDARGRSGD